MTSLKISDCATQFAECVTKQIDILNDMFHFWVDEKSNRACFGLTLNEEKYMHLEDLSPVLFTSMVKWLLRFEQQQRVGATANGANLSILTYHFGWKTSSRFHIKLHPESLDEFRSLIIHYNCSVQVAETLMSRQSFHTKFQDFESELKFIIANIDDANVFHVEDYVDDMGVRKLFICRKYYCIVAMNAISIDECEDPYSVAYHHARTLEVRFGDGVVGGVNFAIDHIKKQIWVWANCFEDQYEANVLEKHVPLITKTGEFKQYNKLQPPQVPKECREVFLTHLCDDVIRNDLEKFFSHCGEIVDVRIRGIKGKRYAFVNFKNEKAVEEALLLDNKPLPPSGRMVKINWNPPRQVDMKRD